MIKKQLSKWMLCALVAPLLVGGALQAEDKQKTQKKTIVIQRTGGQPGIIIQKRIVAAEDNPYWIGVHLATLSPVLKAQLNLKHGYAVAQVVADSPAAKADLKQHDILLAVGGVELTGDDVLPKAVGKSEGKATKLTLMRGGKKQTIDITPVKRPAKFALPAVPQIGPGGDFGIDRKALEKMFKDAEKFGKGPGRMFFLRPGVVVPNFPGNQVLGGKDGGIPENTSITINKQNDKPAKITVKRDGKTYETTEDKLDTLPPDVRKYVERMLGKGVGGHFDFRVPGIKVHPIDPRNPPFTPRQPRAGKVIPPQAPRIVIPPQDNLQKQLGEVLKRLEKLQNKVDELEKKK